MCYSLMNKLEDRDDKGRVSYVEFFTGLGVNIRPGDLEGLSTQITQENEAEVERLHEDQYAR